MIIRSRIVVPVVEEPIENGAVVIAGDRIADLGPFTEIKAGYGGEVRDIGEQILLPGLINGHCHLDYTLLRNRIPPQRTFTDWIHAINSRKAELSEEDYLASIEAGLAEAQKFGTTTLLNLEAFPNLLQRISRPFLRVWWCAEMIDVREEVPVHKVTKQLRDWFKSNPEWLGGFGLAPHALFTASTELISAASDISRKYQVPVTTHLAESQEEMQMFRHANGPLFSFLKSIGRNMDDCGDKTPLASLLARHAVDQRWIIAHLNELSDEDFALLARVKNFQIAHCPRSHTFFGHTQFQLHRLMELGFNICLGTDSLASNSSLSLFSEMRELLAKQSWISAREALTMATINGAGAIGQGDSLGRISPGFRADLIAIPVAQDGKDVFDAIVEFESEVSWMMVAGKEKEPS